MMNYNQVKEVLANGKVEKADSKVITPDAFRNNKLAYDLVMQNCQNIGGKRFCYIPLDLLEIDEDYQRIFCISMQKIHALTQKWDKNKCDPILVAPHPETSTFAVIDGSHRMLVAGILHKEGVVAVLADDLSDDPTKRKIQEAELFSEQETNTDHLSPSHKHKAYVTRGIKKYCVLDKCIQGRRLLLSAHELKNMVKEKQDALRAADYCVLTGYNAAVQAAAMANGEETLTNIFNIIEEAGWHGAVNGYGANVIVPVKSVLNLHDNDPKVIKAIINFFRPMEPDTFFARAHAKYEGRKEKERLTMYLEEEVAKRLGIQPLYTGGDLRKVTAGINSQRYYGATGTEGK